MQTGLGQEQSRERRAVAPSLENEAEEPVSKGRCVGKGRGAQMELSAHGDPILFSGDS